MPPPAPANTCAAVAAVSAGQTQLVAPLIPYDTRTDRFTPDDFALSPDETTLTCPRGRSSTTAYRSQSGQGRNFRFTAKQCAGCPLADQCRGAEVPPDHMRQVFVSDFRSAVALARTYAQTEDFKADMKVRATIERIIANLVRYHDARYARRRGQRNCQYQAHMNAMAFNLRQWLRQLARAPRPRPGSRLNRGAVYPKTGEHPTAGAANAPIALAERPTGRPNRPNRQTVSQ